jgi:ketosteroid isomerase-like protein
MSPEKNVQIVKNFLAALGRRDKQELLALSAEDIEWIIPGEDWPLAGTHCGHAGLNHLVQKAKMLRELREDIAELTGRRNDKERFKCRDFPLENGITGTREFRPPSPRSNSRRMTP